MSLILSAFALVLTVGGCERRERQAVTPAAVLAHTTIDFAAVADYSTRSLPAYFDRTVAALDDSSTPNAVDNRVATLGRVLFYDQMAHLAPPLSGLH